LTFDVPSHFHDTERMYQSFSKLMTLVCYFCHTQPSDSAISRSKSSTRAWSCLSALMTVVARRGRAGGLGELMTNRVDLDFVVVLN
jgi:hypothetical protein